MNTLFEDVVDFHKKFKINYSGPPRKLPFYTSLFRKARFNEEIREILQSKTHEQELDGYVDLVYIILGTCHLHGWDFDKAWQRVHIANMTKERASKDNPGKYSELGCTQDIVKPADWQPPDLSDLVC